MIMPQCILHLYNKTDRKIFNNIVESFVRNGVFNSAVFLTIQWDSVNDPSWIQTQITHTCKTCRQNGMLIIFLFILRKHLNIICIFKNNQL